MASQRRQWNIEPSLMHTRASHSTATNTSAHRAHTRKQVAHTGARSNAHAHTYMCARVRARTVNRLHLISGALYFGDLYNSHNAIRYDMTI